MPCSYAVGTAAGSGVRRRSSIDAARCITSPLPVSHCVSCPIPSFTSYVPTAPVRKPPTPPPSPLRRRRRTATGSRAGGSGGSRAGCLHVVKPCSRLLRRECVKVGHPQGQQCGRHMRQRTPHPARRQPATVPRPPVAVGAGDGGGIRPCDRGVRGQGVRGWRQDRPCSSCASSCASARPVRQWLFCHFELGESFEVLCPLGSAQPCHPSQHGPAGAFISTYTRMPRAQDAAATAAHVVVTATIFRAAASDRGLLGHDEEEAVDRCSPPGPAAPAGPAPPCTWPPPPLVERRQALLQPLGRRRGVALLQEPERPQHDKGRRRQEPPPGPVRKEEVRHRRQEAAPPPGRAYTGMKVGS